MRLMTLSIENFRGLNFSHNFEADNFIVITGVNGSGKSTIIEAISLLLTQQVNNISEQFAGQVTGKNATFEISIKAEKGEIDYLAEKLHNSQPNQADKKDIAKELREKIFVNDTYSRKIIVKRPILGWRQNDPSYVQDFINGAQVNRGANTVDSVISPQYFTVLSNQILLKFEQLESINLQIQKNVPGSFSIQDIFNATNNDLAQRLSRTNLSASPLLNSLIKYSSIDDSELKRLISEYEQILDPIRFKVLDQANGLSHLALTRDGETVYTVESASSGQKKAIVLATLKYVWKSTSLKPIVLLDEPENSMHPDLTTRIFESLNNLASDEKEKPSFVIATHSAEVVAANAKHTFRITTSDGHSTLTKITGLEERASVMEELGVKFNLDYVAQKIVFVEGVEYGGKQGINDAEAYQTLIDPVKERVLFIECGSKKQAQQRLTLQRELMERLKQTSEVFELMTDRDDSPPDNTDTTPFWDVEYLYVANSELLANSASSVLGRTIAPSEITNLMPSDTTLENTKTKTIWLAFMRNFSVTKEQAQDIQKSILKHLRDDSTQQTDAIQKLIRRYK